MFILILAANDTIRPLSRPQSVEPFFQTHRIPISEVCYYLFWFLFFFYINKSSLEINKRKKNFFFKDNRKKKKDKRKFLS